MCLLDVIALMPFQFTRQVKLLQIFSKYALVYEVQVFDSSDISEGNDLVFIN